MSKIIFSEKTKDGHTVRTFHDESLITPFVTSLFINGVKPQQTQMYRDKGIALAEARRLVKVQNDAAIFAAMP